MDLAKLLNRPTSTVSSLSIPTLLNPCEDDHQVVVHTRKRLRTCVDSPFTSPVSVASWPEAGDVTSLGDVISVPIPLTLTLGPKRDIKGYPQELPHSVARRLAQSRIVGLRHRENEKLRKQTLELDLTQLQDENDMLAYRIREARRATLNINIPKSTSTSNSNNSEIVVHVLHQLRPMLRDILGTTSLSGETAMLLLELVALRRNLTRAQYQQDVNTSTSSLECPEYAHIESAVHGRAWTPESIECHAMWADYEANSMATEEKEKLEKRCTRCAKLRSAGSGHPRSSCDDGFRVASAIPYSE